MANEPDLSAPPAGRPLKFKDLKQLQQKINEYFGNCDPHLEERLILKTRATGEQYSAYEKVITEQEPYLITGLAVHLGCSRTTLLHYQTGSHISEDMDEQTKQEIMDAIKAAKDRCEQYAEGQLYKGKQATGPIFNLKNNHAWKDQSEVLNKNQNVADDLDDLDEQKDQVAEAAKKKLEEGDGTGPPAAEQVVAPDSPVQDPQ